MKKLLFIIGIFICTLSNSQTITITDNTFRIELQQRFPTCMNGNNLDVACIDALNITRLTIHSSFALPIFSLNGIQAFVDLKYLNIKNNALSTLSSLPAGLDTLICVGNGINNLGTLPSTLKYLNCSNNNVSLYSCPVSLQWLDVSWNNLTIPPSNLPNGLKYFACNNNNIIISPISTFSTLNSLEVLNCSNNPFIPSPSFLPPNLKILSCSNTSFFNLPNLPNSLEELYCNLSKLNSLPVLSLGLKKLDCSSNNLSSLPNLPSNLTSFSCGDNNLSSLPNLPSNLISLSCGDNNLSNLPMLPNTLRNLSCSANNLTNLPSLPNNLEYLDIGNNNISTITYLPNKLIYFKCNDNNLTSLPPLPQLNYLNCNNNTNLKCLPQLSSNMQINISNTGITCLPNYTPYVNPTISAFNLPLCQVGNLNNCQSQNVTAIVYFDSIPNCILNFNETKRINKITLKLTNTNTLASEITNGSYNGIYGFSNIQNGLYNLSIDSVPAFLQACTPSHTITLTAANPDTSGLNFGLQCKPNTFDLGTKSIIPVGPVFPGQQHTLKVQTGDLSQFYNFNCTASQNIGATVTVNVSGPVQYVSPAVGALTPSNVGGNILTYNIANISNANLFDAFNSTFKTDTTAQAGDSVCVLVTITTPQSGDVDPLNNTFRYCYLVVNSYDPNIKVVNKAIVKPSFNDWLTYTIYFQNTGNAPAYNIKLVDTLDNALDLNTFEVINYSHENSFNLNSTNRRLQVNYPNILLPDSTSNPLGSIGHIQYRIKPSAPMALNSQIKNKASIYFDFNAPIATNTVTTTATNSVGLAGIKNRDEAMQLQPNPASQSLHIAIGKEKMDYISITELSGKVLLKKKVNVDDNKIYFDLSGIENGLYLVNGYVEEKIVKGKKLVVSK
jgi:uncharacterized repeat protein (TIGR01451 family)